MATKKKLPEERVYATYSTDALLEEICARIADGETLPSICKDEHMPSKRTIMNWLSDDKHVEFQNAYRRAREHQADHFADEMIEIADDGSNDWMDRETKSGRIERVIDHEHVQRSRLRIDSRKWLMQVSNPRKYGDRVRQEHTGADGGPIEYREMSDLEIARRMVALLDKAVNT